MDAYNFKQFEKDLENGFQIYLKFVNNKYLIYKTNNNCYTQELVDWSPNKAQPKISIITHKRLYEIFLSAENFEYKH